MDTNEPWLPRLLRAMTSWSVRNALALGGAEVIANNIWALKSGTIQDRTRKRFSLYLFLSCFFFPSRRWMTSNHTFFSSSEQDLKRARSAQTCWWVCSPIQRLPHVLASSAFLVMSKHREEMCEPLDCSRRFYSPFSVRVPSLGVDIIMCLSETDCHSRASIMHRNWQQTLPLGFADVLCMLLYSLAFSKFRTPAPLMFIPAPKCGNNDWNFGSKHPVDGRPRSSLIIPQNRELCPPTPQKI